VLSLPITGTGAVASIGHDPAEIFANLCAGHGGRSALRGFDAGRFGAQHLFEIDDRPAPGIDEPGRATRFLLDAVAQAATDAGLGEDLSRIPIVVGTGLRELRSAELWWRDGTPFDADRLAFGPALRERFGALDTWTMSNACSASLYALACGADLIELGLAEVVVVAGVDVVTESMFGLSDRVQRQPPGHVLPFDARRRGTILGEGAAAVVLRREARPGDRVHGRLRGVGVNCDAHHATAPDLAGVTGAIRQAHDRAGVTPDEIDLIIAHGTGTPLNDRAEASATAEVFGVAAGRPLITGIKSLTGHTSGSAGVLSLVVALRALAEGVVPPIANLTEPLAEGAGLRLAMGAVVPHHGVTAQVNGFGFGGVNAVAVVGAA
jgi:3-oxoacyl-[acyl-carrier-protein] synthase II